MPRVINSGKSETKLWLKFSVLVLKGLKILSVIVNSGFSNLFLTSGSRFRMRIRIQAEIEADRTGSASKTLTVSYVMSESEAHLGDSLVPGAGPTRNQLTLCQYQPSCTSKPLVTHYSSTSRMLAKNAINNINFSVCY